MKAVTVFLLMHGVLCLCYAVSEEQTDWSDGPVVWGAVPSFGTSFHIDTDVRWTTTNGSLMCSFYPTETVVTGMLAKRLAAADLDLDGYQDLLFSTSPSTHLIGASFNQGSGTDWVTYSLFDGSSNIQWFGIADMDGDGDLDVSGTQWGNAIWLENPSAQQGNWNVHAVPYTLSSNIGLPADMDDDGDADLVTRTNMYTIRWYENSDGSGDSWEEHIISPLDSICMYEMGDLNGDGLLDIAVTRNLQGELVWLEHSTGSGNWTVHEVANSYQRPFNVLAVDIDCDGDCDLVVSSFPYSTLSIFENTDGLGNSWSERTISDDIEQITQLSAVDYDKDGDLDILAGTANDFAHLFENMDGIGQEWFEYSFQALAFYARAACSGDFDGDNETDFAFRSNVFGDEVIWCRLDYITGSLESNLLDTGTDAQWGSIDWNGIEQSSTSLCFQVRSSDSPDVSQMPVWSDTLWYPGSLQGVLTDGDRYVQYRAILMTDDPAATPVLEDVTISWNQSGTESETRCVLPLITFASNPSHRQVAVTYSTEQPSAVIISLFDITGRMQREYANENLTEGMHTTQFFDITPGVYYLRIDLGGEMQTCKIAVID